MKKVISYIIIIFICSITVTFILISGNPNNKEKSFKRSFIEPNVNIEGVFDLQSPSFYFAGKSTNKILLRDSRNPLYLSKLDYTLRKLDKTFLNFPFGFNSKSSTINLGVRSSYIYATNGSSDIAIILKDTAHYFKASGLLFDQTYAISPNSIIVRATTIVNGKKQYELTKLSLLNSSTISKRFVLPKQENSRFSTDGWLDYDTKHSKVFYMYFYRGEYLCLDTNLNLVYKGKTIDTIQTAKIKLDTIKTKLKNGQLMKSVTQGSPPNLVNDYFTINQDKIYVHSRLKADNELFFSFIKKSPIDVYSLNDGEYLYSFYIPKYKGIKMSEFQIKNNAIVAIYKNYLVTFSLNEK